MTFIRNAARIATGATLGLALAAGTAFAQDAMIDDDLAAQIEQDIHLLPPTSETMDTTGITVEAADGRLVVTGLVQDQNIVNEIQDMIREQDVDLEMVDMNLVVQ